MYKPADMTAWQGRIDAEEEVPALRWHQKIQRWDGNTTLNNCAALLGFACDEGVRRNQGRVGAREGPHAIRGALANMAYLGNTAVFDAGDVFCDDKTWSKPNSYWRSISIMFSRTTAFLWYSAAVTRWRGGAFGESSNTCRASTPVKSWELSISTPISI